MTEPARKSDENAQPDSPKKKSDPFVGKVFNGRFHVKSLIARGGLGAVYLAEQAPLGRKCAIKILRPRYEGTSQDEFHKRFFLEASIASKLNHPNNVTLFDYGHTDDGTYFMAMEYLEGVTLAKAIRQEGPFSEERALHITRQICRALREAHSLGVIHRDIKPGNIFLTHFHDQEDFVKVLDFGLVKNVETPDTEDLTQAGVFMGSPKYMAPEQVQGDDMDARTDIYALGIVMYEMLVGRVPFNESTSVKTLIAHVNQPAPPMRQLNPSIDVSPAIEQIVFKCIEKSAGDRFASVDDLLALLKTAEGGALTATLSSSDVSGAFSTSSTSGMFPMASIGSSSTSGPVLQPNAVGQSTSQAVVSDELQQAQPKRSKTPLIIGGIALVAIIGVVGIVLGQNSGKSSDHSASVNASATSSHPTIAATSAAVAPKPSATKTAPAASSAVASVRPPLHLTTHPAKARVFVNDAHGKVLCELTPCDIKRADLPKGIHLYLVKRGYVAVRKEVGEDMKNLEVTFARLPVHHHGGGKKPPAAPTGINAYKQDPY